MTPTRTVVLDTETTGLKPEEGHRIVEVAFIELIDGERTGNHFHSLINPERHIPEEVVKIHGIDDEKVKDAPKFRDVLAPILTFLRDGLKPTELVAHNLQFDLGFLHMEMFKADCEYRLLLDIPNVTTLTCTRDMSYRTWPNARRHRLDDVLDRLQIDRSARTFHGAMLDAELCADALMGMRRRAGT